MKQMFTIFVNVYDGTDTIASKKLDVLCTKEEATGLMAYGMHEIEDSADDNPNIRICE